MSYTTIIHVYPGEKIECGEELKNAWGSAPYIWDYLIKKYIDPEGNMMYEKYTKVLWGMWKDSSVPIEARVVLMMTFDRAYITKENYSKAANAIRKFLEIHNNTNVVNHWPRIAEIFESNPDIPAIGLWCTSVSENPFNGGYDEEKEEYLLPNWDECYDIYKVLGEIEKESEAI